MDRKTLKSGLKLIGIALFLIVILKTDLKQMAGTLSGINFWWFSVAILFFIPITHLKTIRWMKILKGQNIRLSMLEGLPLIVIGQYLATVTPGNLGDFSRVILLKDKTDNTYGSFFSILVERVLDLCFLFIVAGVGISLILKLSEQVKGYLVSIIIIILFLSALLYFLSVHRRPVKFVIDMVPSKLKGLAADFFSRINENIILPGKKDAAIIVVMTFFLGVLILSRWYFIALALGINLSYFHTLLFMAIVQLVTVIPISILGIGTRDAALVVLFSQFGLPAAQAVSFSVIVLFINLMVVIPGIFLSFKYKLSEQKI